MTETEFLELARSLAAAAGQEIAWTQATGVIHGFLDSAFEHIGRWNDLSLETGKPVAELLADSLARGLWTFFEQQQADAALRRELAEDLVDSLESHGYIDSGLRVLAVDLLEQRLASPA